MPCPYKFAAQVFHVFSTDVPPKNAPKLFEKLFTGSHYFHRAGLYFPSYTYALSAVIGPGFAP